MTIAEPSLRRNFSWTLFGNVVFSIALYGVLVVLTKLGTKEIVGRFSLGSAVATPFIMFANLQLRVLFVTDAENRHAFGDYLGVRLVAQPLAFLSIVVVAFVFYSWEQAIVITIFATAKIIESFTDLCYALAQKNERIDLMARSMLIRGPLAMLLFGIVFAASGSLPGALAGWALAWLLVMVFYDVPRARMIALDRGLPSLRPRFKGAIMKTIVWSALPMGLVMLLLQLRQTIPRTVLERYFGEGELGIFAALSYLVIAGSTMALALSQSAIARLSRYYADGNAIRFRDTVLKLFLFGVVLAGGGVLLALVAGEFLLRLLYTDEFAVHADVFVWIMAGGGLLYLAMLVAAPVSAMRRFTAQLWIQLANAALMLGLALWLIPDHGLMGAAWCMLGGAFWMLLSYTYLVFTGYRRLKART